MIRQVSVTDVYDAILDEIRESPNFAEYVEALNETLQREKKRRARFRAAMNEDTRAEFINGRVVKQMPAKLSHAGAVRRIGTLLDTSVSSRELGVVVTEQALVEFPRNDYAPDICFWKTSKSKLFTQDQTVYPIPDFICEVLSKSTMTWDRIVKFRDYQARGVGEYWLVHPDHEVIEQNVLVGDRYELVGEFSEGVIRSKVIRGFKMPVRAAFDQKEYLAYLKTIMAS